MPAQCIEEFDTWQAGYGAASVEILVAGTSTLASVFTDEALTVTAANPQTLLSQTINNVTYGKFTAPLYTGQAYQLEINNTDNTGIQRPPLTTLDGQDASNATAIPTGGTEALNLEDALALYVDARAYGDLGTAESAATNNATLTAAIGRASTLVGADVLIPISGSIPFTSLSIPAGVRLVGLGRAATTLQSQTAGNVITFSGDRAGLKDLTVDGVNNQAGSVGVYSKAKNETRFDNVEIKRFETDLFCRGGRRHDWKELYLSSAVNGGKLYGDNDASGGANGDEFRNNSWVGGKVTNCTTVGVDLTDVDKKCYQNWIADVGFEDNTGIALRARGCRYTNMPGCWFTGNTTNIDIRDATDATRSDENRVSGLRIGPGARINGGAINITGLAQDVIFDGAELTGSLTITLTTVVNTVLALDCTEDANVVITGTAASQWTRAVRANGDAPSSFGLTTDATATVGWQKTLDPGQVVNLEAIVVGVQRNSEDYAIYHIARSIRRPGSTLAYDGQTSNFTLGDIVTGATSGAKGRVLADADAGATGTLTIKDITKEFIDNELLTGAIGGAAVVNGVLSHQNAALLSSTTSIETAVETVAGWACDFTVSAGNAQVTVTGAAGDTVEWTVSVKQTIG